MPCPSGGAAIATLPGCKKAAVEIHGGWQTQVLHAPLARGEAADQILVFEVRRVVGPAGGGQTGWVTVHSSIV